MTENYQLMARRPNDPLQEVLYLVLSCMFLSFQNGGFWLLLPLLNGTIAFGIALIIAFLSALDPYTRGFYWKKQYGYGILVALVLSLINMLYTSTAFTSSEFLTFFYCFVTMLIAAHYSDERDHRKPLLIFIFIELIFKMGVNIFAILRDPGAIRNSGFNAVVLTGDGAEKLISIKVLYTLAVVCFIFLSHFGKIKHKIAAILMVVAIIWLLYMAQMSLVLLTTMILIVYIFLINPRYYKRSIIIGVLLGILLLIFLPNIIEVILKNRWFGPMVRERLADTYEVFFSGNTFEEIVDKYGTYQYSFRNSSTKMRLYHYISSIRAFFNNFFLGELTPNALQHGAHSLFFDLIAEYGCLIFALIFSVVKYIKDLMNFNDAQNRKAVLCFSIAYVILSLINRYALVYFFIQLYIILPHFYELFVSEKT